MDSKTYYEIWNRVERAAFMPEPKEVKKWLSSLNSFFNKTTGKPNLKWNGYNKKKCIFNDSMNYDSMNLVCRYKINKDLSGFSFKITLLEQTVSFEYSNREFCEFDYLTGHCDKRAENIDKDNLVEVLKQKIAHPAIHLHLTDDDSLHEIRLGVATRNPFVFLYQFVFQMIAEKKNESTRLERYDNSPLKEIELNRLADLIGEEIENGRISPGKLLAG
ncbi:MAG: hypothetical protein JRG74_11545 [Deltaproteobacteria bacterium]|nr:hypothetical protein [Deltaproteobacteria bacterium]MBW1835040.1 hypothetical protein [Deltaproteobacteria bacterium]MBW2166691.1 hypothetical protein [Deltaproteobacteria bacterium]